MELKKYQQDVINDLDCYIEQLEEDRQLSKAFNNFWEKKGISLASLGHLYLRPYDDSITGVPHVTVKVPTAGGKTFIACNALRTIFSHMPSEKPRVVAWFVPSDTILKQTYKNLNDPSHPYRQKINSHFGNAVCVLDKEAALFGQGISPTEVQEQLTIFVLSVQSFAANNKDGRRVYRENGSLAEYPRQYDRMTKRVDGADETGFIQVLSYLNPVVIIDESHNFEANLRIDMIKSINPCFILDLTATPRKKSNIISFVDAMKLKQANMVKLPVIVYNHQSTSDVIASSIQLQRSLEQKALAQEAEGGRYIRPIVLFQAQPKTDNDNVTFDKIKVKLIEIGIPEEQIKIKTADKDEIKNMDLLSRDCPVRYIITVNALKEGWDCPFAYILASLANKSSRVDVEQILGRILRLPYTIQQKDELLNMSYVFTSSHDFRDTIENIIDSLNRAGFSKKDYRVAETSNKMQSQLEFPPLVLREEDVLMREQYEDGIPEIDTDAVKTVIQRPVSSGTSDLEKFARQENYNYNQQMEEALKQNDGIPNDIKDMVPYYKIKDFFIEEAGKIILPQFVKKVNKKSIFEPEGSNILLEKSMLSEGFNLDKQDHNIDFTPLDIEATSIDLEKVGNDEYRVGQGKFPVWLKEFFMTLPSESQKEQLAGMIAKNIRIDEIADPYIVRYVKEAINDLDSEHITNLFVNLSQTSDMFKHKILDLLNKYQKEVFKKWLDIGQIQCVPMYKLPDALTFKSVVKGISKGLYTEEEDVNDLEYKIINAVANLENVRFWHRNTERGQGFRINGYTRYNHYPDFIVRLNSGKTILIETKGDDRDNSDTRDKIELGRIWANKAGEDYRYFMVFDKTQMEGAITVSELLDRLKEM